MVNRRTDGVEGQNSAAAQCVREASQQTSATLRPVISTKFLKSGNTTISLRVLTCDSRLKSELPAANWTFTDPSMKSGLCVATCRPAVRYT